MGFLICGWSVLFNMVLFWSAFIPAIGPLATWGDFKNQTYQALLCTIGVDSIQIDSHVVISRCSMALPCLGLVILGVSGLTALYALVIQKSNATFAFMVDCSSQPVAVLFWLFPRSSKWKESLLFSVFHLSPFLSVYLSIDQPTSGQFRKTAHACRFLFPEVASSAGSSTYTNWQITLIIFSLVPITLGSILFRKSSPVETSNSVRTGLRENLDTSLMRSLVTDS